MNKLAAAIAARHSNMEAFAAKHSVFWPIRTNVYGTIGFQGNASTSNPIGIILNIGVSFRSEELLFRKALNLRPFSDWIPSKSVVCINSALGYSLPDIALGSDSFDIFQRKFEPLFHEQITKQAEGFSDENLLIEELYQTYHQGGGKAERLIAFLLTRRRTKDAFSIAETCATLHIYEGRETSALNFYDAASKLLRKD